MNVLHQIVLHDYILFFIRFYYPFSIHYLTLLFFSFLSSSFFFFFLVCMCARERDVAGRWNNFRDQVRVFSFFLCWIWVYSEWVFSVCVWFRILGFWVYAMHFGSIWFSTWIGFQRFDSTEQNFLRSICPLIPRFLLPFPLSLFFLHNE